MYSGSNRVNGRYNDSSSLCNVSKMPSSPTTELPISLRKLASAPVVGLSNRGVLHPLSG